MLSRAAILAAVPRITAKFLETDSKIHVTPHTGIDYAVNEGTKLLSASSGVIEDVVDYGSTNIGKGVFVRLDNGVKLIYGHMSKIDVSPGQKVRPGDLIGLSGNTGRSTGPHVHLQAYNAAGELIDPGSWAENVFNSPKFVGGWVGSAIEDLHGIKENTDKVIHYANPFNWLKDSWKWLEVHITDGSLDESLIVMTIVVVWLTMLGAKKPRKYCFWTWVIYLVLRGVIFKK